MTINRFDSVAEASKGVEVSALPEGVARRVAEKIGVKATYILSQCRRKHGMGLYVPCGLNKGDLLYKILGKDASERLRESFGGQWIDLPNLMLHGACEE
jgi:hypothetical protein